MTPTPPSTYLLRPCIEGLQDLIRELLAEADAHVPVMTPEYDFIEKPSGDLNGDRPVRMVRIVCRIVAKMAVDLTLPETWPAGVEAFPAPCIIPLGGAFEDFWLVIDGDGDGFLHRFILDEDAGLEALVRRHLPDAEELAGRKLAILSGIEQVEVQGPTYSFVLNVEMS